MQFAGCWGSCSIRSRLAWFQTTRCYDGAASATRNRTGALAATAAAAIPATGTTTATGTAAAAAAAAETAAVYRERSGVTGSAVSRLRESPGRGAVSVRTPHRRYGLVFKLVGGGRVRCRHRRRRSGPPRAAASLEREFLCGPLTEDSSYRTSHDHIGLSFEELRNGLSGCRAMQERRGTYRARAG